MNLFDQRLSEALDNKRFILFIIGESSDWYGGYLIPFATIEDAYNWLIKTRPNMRKIPVKTPNDMLNNMSRFGYYGTDEGSHGVRFTRSTNEDDVAPYYGAPPPKTNKLSDKDEWVGNFFKTGAYGTTIIPTHLLPTNKKWDLRDKIDDVTYL